MAIRADNFFDSVVERLEERVGHGYDGSRDYLLLVALQQFLLLVCHHLDLLQVGLTCSLSQDAFVFASRTIG